MSKIHQIDMPAELKRECWHQYDRNQKAWLVWKPQDCENDSDLQLLAMIYKNNPKIGRKSKPPILVWADGRVRVQFVGNFDSSIAAVRSLEAQQ
jgi:hypothetical protein